MRAIQLTGLKLEQSFKVSHLTRTASHAGIRIGDEIIKVCRNHVQIYHANAFVENTFKCPMRRVQCFPLPCNWQSAAANCKSWNYLYSYSFFM